MHTTLALSPTQSELMARHAQPITDINHPPAALELPAELLELRKEILAWFKLD